jgi:signal transduction histidine kinase
VRLLHRPLSLRSRLALGFTIGSAVVVLGAGIFLYVAIDRALLGAVDDGLRARSSDLEAILRDQDTGDFPTQDPFAQVLRADGSVIASSPPTSAGTPSLQFEELGALTSAAIERPVAQLGGDARLLVRQLNVRGQILTLVVGVPLDQYRVTQQRLVLVLLIGGPILIATVALAGWVLAGAALRPVVQMSAEADEISIADLSRRLEVPAADDEVAHLARTLNGMLDRVEQAIGHERRFIDDASHELRTPLTILRGELELALLQADDPDEVLAAVRSSLEEAHRLSRLSDDLLVLARARAGELRVRSTAVDLTAAATRVCELLAGVGGPDLVVTGEPRSLMADPDRIDQILMNLIVNAQRFARSRVEVRVSRSVDAARQRTPGGVTLVVADDGDGFATDLLPVTFERFRRDDPARARGTGGTGLGLAIAAELVRAHGGTIVAGNGDRLGGAWVQVWLPRMVRGDADDREPAPQVRDVDQAEPGAPGRR